MPRHRLILILIGISIVTTLAASQQLTLDPFPTPIETTKGVIAVDFVEFATLPDVNGEAPRMMHFTDEPGTRRIFVSLMTGGLYSLSYDGKTVAAVPRRQRSRVERRRAVGGIRARRAELRVPSAVQPARHARLRKVLHVHGHVQHDAEGRLRHARLETHARHGAARVDGEGRRRPRPTTARAPREIFRAAQPFNNHNGGQIGFNPLAAPGGAEFGLLYIGLADGGSGGDPLNVAQNLSSAFGKILRIDPLGTSSANGRYGIPASNPFVAKAAPGALGEIYASGVRNPQRFSWDSKTGRLYLADIGQNAVEEISPVTAGANLGWNKWEASFPYVNGQVDASKSRSEPDLTWPVVEFDHRDPLFQRAAITGVIVYRQAAIRELQNMMVFGDNPSGQIFCVDADNLPDGGQSAIRQVLLNDKGSRKTLLQLIVEKNTLQKKEPAARADLRFGEGPQGQIFVMNKRDGVIRLLVPNRQD